MFYFFKFYFDFNGFHLKKLKIILINLVIGEQSRQYSVYISELSVWQLPLRNLMFLNL